jgi:hypothetical protein
MKPRKAKGRPEPVVRAADAATVLLGPTRKQPQMAGQRSRSLDSLVMRAV